MTSDADIPSAPIVPGGHYELGPLAPAPHLRELTFTDDTCEEKPLREMRCGPDCTRDHRRCPICGGWWWVGQHLRCM